MDWPGGFFYRELTDFYPDAKVLLSVREPQKWEHSYRETIWNLLTATRLCDFCRAPAAQSIRAGRAISNWSSACSGANCRRSAPGEHPSR